MTAFLLSGAKKFCLTRGTGLYMTALILSWKIFIDAKVAVTNKIL